MPLSPLRRSTRPRRDSANQTLQPRVTRRGTVFGRVTKPRPHAKPRATGPVGKRASAIETPVKVARPRTEPTAPASPLREGNTAAAVVEKPSAARAAHLALSFDTNGPPVARQQLFNRISSLISAALNLENPATSLYVCGTPGTGKTLTVTNVLRRIAGYQDDGDEAVNTPSDAETEEDMAESQGLPAMLETQQVQHTWVNCAHLSNARDLFAEVAQKLNLPSASNADAAKAAIRAFAQSSGPRVVLVLDEVDFLSSRDQRVLYAAFEWPHLPKSRLVLVGIANAIDLPVRLLPWLRANRCMPIVVQFTPYDSAALTAIVGQRLQQGGDGRLNTVAVSLAAKKVAAGSGDARLVLDVCREAEVTLRREDGKASNAISVVSSILNKRGGMSAAVDTIKQLPVQQQLALCVAANAVVFGDGAPVTARPGRKPLNRKATLGGLYDSFSRMCARTRVSGVPFQEFADICSNALVHHGLLEVPESRRRGKNSPKTLRSKAVRLRVPIEDVRAGVAERGFLSLLIAR